MFYSRNFSTNFKQKEVYFSDSLEHILTLYWTIKKCRCAQITFRKASVPWPAPCGRTDAAACGHTCWRTCPETVFWQRWLSVSGVHTPTLEWTRHHPSVKIIVKITSHINESTYSDITVIVYLVLLLWQRHYCMKSYSFDYNEMSSLDKQWRIKSTLSLDLHQSCYMIRTLFYLILGNLWGQWEGCPYPLSDGRKGFTWMLGVVQGQTTCEFLQSIVKHNSLIQIITINTKQSWFSKLLSLNTKKICLKI